MTGSRRRACLPPMASKSRPWSTRGKTSQPMADVPWPVFAGAVVERAEGGRTLRGVAIRDAGGARHDIACDLLAICNGWNPLLHLTTHLGGRPVWDESLQAFMPGTLAARHERRRGRRAVISRSRESLSDGARLGAEAAQQLGFDAVTVGASGCEREGERESDSLWRVGASKSFAFVDLQNDVTTKDIELAKREGFGASEHVKRYTTLGMGTDQGKTANVVALGVLAEITGRAIPGPWAPRFPSALCARSLGARSPDIIAARTSGRSGCRRRMTGRSRMARCSPRPGPGSGRNGINGLTRRAGRRAYRARRRPCGARSGVCDVSTLGKIDIQGPDAAAFLDRVYVNKFVDAEGRPRALRADAARGRLRHG